MPQHPDWATMKLADKTAYKAWALSHIDQRWELGKNKYDSEEQGFQGNPLEHLIEELFDAMLYTYYTLRRIQAAVEPQDLRPEDWFDEYREPDNPISPLPY